MEERDGGIDEERVAGDPRPKGPISGQVEPESGDDGGELGATVEEDLEEDGDPPYHQRRTEECPRLVLSHSLSLSLAAEHWQLPDDWVL